MIGDKMYLYDRVNDVFFGGWRNSRNGKKRMPIWCTTSKKAKVMTVLRVAYELKEALGVRIVSETEAHKIDALREYREGAEDDGSTG